MCMLLTLLVSRCSSKIGVEMAGMSAVCWHQWWSNGSVLGIVVVEGGVEAIGAMVVRGEVVELTTLERGSGDESEDTTNDTEGGRPPAVPLMIMMVRNDLGEPTVGQKRLKQTRARCKRSSFLFFKQV